MSRDIVRRGSVQSCTSQESLDEDRRQSLRLPADVLTEGTYTERRQSISSDSGTLGHRNSMRLMIDENM